MPFINDQLQYNQDSISKQANDLKITRTSRFRFDPEEIINGLRSGIVGQDHILETLYDLLVTVKADFGSNERPLGVMLFIGPTGVGKTEIVRLLCKAIYGSTEHLCRIDMNTLAQEHYSAAITGSPPGYVGSKEGQTLFDADAIKGTLSQPAIVLFDEIEKANRDVTRALLNVFDTGKLRLTSGVKEIDFRNAIVFMTSNIGVKEHSEHITSYQRGWRKWLNLKPKDKQHILTQALHQHFDIEFLNRIDHTLIFNTLDQTLQRKIITLEMKKLNKRLEKRQASLTLEPSAFNYLCMNYDEQFGARAISRRIRSKLEPKIAHALSACPQTSTFKAYYSQGKIHVVAAR